MTKRIPQMLIALAVLSVAAAGRAASSPDPLRCQARELRCESELYQCLSRCDQRVPRQTFPAGSRPVSGDAACEESCADRYDTGMARIAASPACAADDAADAALCESRLLRASAARLTCAARCAGRGAAEPACALRCDTRCRAAAAETSAAPVCAAGRLGASPLCGAMP